MNFISRIFAWFSTEKRYRRKFLRKKAGLADKFASEETRLLKGYYHEVKNLIYQHEDELLALMAKQEEAEADTYPDRGDDYSEASRTLNQLTSEQEKELKNKYAAKHDELDVWKSKKKEDLSFRRNKEMKELEDSYRKY
jgi:hypothetical protein